MRQSVFPQSIQYAEGYFHQRKTNPSNNLASPITQTNSRPVAGGGAGGARAPPEIFRLELNSATKVEFFY